MIIPDIMLILIDVHVCVHAGMALTHQFLPRNKLPLALLDDELTTHPHPRSENLKNYQHSCFSGKFQFLQMTISTVSAGPKFKFSKNPKINEFDPTLGVGAFFLLRK